MQGNSRIILEKLDDFIRKFYKNELIKGALLGLAGIATAFIIASTLEYFGQFDVKSRTILFGIWALFSAVVLWKYVIIPLLHLYKIGKIIDYQTAAKIVGGHFPEIQDKLLNTLQLEEQRGQNDNALLEAAIEQRISTLKPIPFQTAIDFSKNFRLARIAAIPLIILVAVFILFPGFTESSKRLVNFNTYYEKAAPFYFELQNENLQAVQNQDFELIAAIKGQVVPDEVYIEYNQFRYKMRKDDDGMFRYLLRNLKEPMEFQLNAAGYYSKPYELQVVPKPLLLDFEANIIYPSYTGRKNESMRNIGDFTVPAGTEIQWNFNTRNVEQLRLFFNGKKTDATGNGNRFSASRRFLQSETLSLHTSNRQMKSSDSVRYEIQVIPDAFPQVEFKQTNDSSSARSMYFIGRISDDYGFQKLTFNYRFVASEDAFKLKQPLRSIPIKIERDRKLQTYYYYWDLSKENIKSADKLEYYFEVWDNDAVNGSKSTRTIFGAFQAPTSEQLEKETEKSNQEIKADLQQGQKDLKQMDEEIRKIQEKLTEKKSLSWEDKKKIEDMLKKHEQMQDQLKNVVEQNKEKNNRENEFKSQDSEILQKQEELEKLFQEVMTDEMKEMMDKIRDLMQQNNKDQLQQELEKFKFNEKELSKQMDRMLELFKQLELEKKMNETIQKLDKLAEEQKKLAKETEKKSSDSEQLSKKQEELNKKFEDVKKDLKDVEKKNEALQKPQELSKTEKEQKEIEKDMKEGKEDLDKKENGAASQKQKKAAEKIEELSEKMKESAAKNKKEKHVEDYNTLREILENLIQVSKDQEKVMEEFKLMQEYNPKYVSLGQLQKKIKDDTKMIEDSLFALSKRVAEVQSFINKEIGLVNLNIDKSLAHIGERQTHQVVNHQQLAMTSLNNLALMLSDVLKQMQDQMKQPSNGSCNNPGQGKKSQSPSMNSLKQMQEGLAKQMEKLMKGQQQGQQPNSKEFAEAMAQQAAIRKKLRDLQKQLEKEGKGGGKLGDLNKTQEMMDQLERDLAHKRLNPDVIKRQQEILHRLLEHEKAERQQEQEERRKSNEGKDMLRDLPPSLQQYLKEKEKEQELLKTLPPDLSPYYKDKVREYYKQIGVQ